MPQFTLEVVDAPHLAPSTVQAQPPASTKQGASPPPTLLCLVSARMVPDRWRLDGRLLLLDLPCCLLRHCQRLFVGIGTTPVGSHG